MKCLPFVDARRYVHQRKIKNQDEWNVFCKSGNKPDNIPANPRRSYKKEWISWGDWLGSNRIANQNKEYYSFVEARKMVHSLGLKSRNEWRRYVKSGKKPEKIPSNPAQTFKQDWKGWGDWLGTGTIAVFNKKFKAFREARNYAQSLHLNGQNDWSEFCKSKLRPIDIPSMPSRVYKDEWRGWGDWLGTGRIASQDIVYRSFFWRQLVLIHFHSRSGMSVTVPSFL